VSLPFELRLLNGKNPPVPEVTVHKIVKDRVLASTSCTSRRFLGSSTGTNGGGSRNGEFSMYDLINQFAQRAVRSCQSAAVWCGSSELRPTLK